jgi:hypothetical protein
MPRVKGFLRILKRRGHGGPVDPDYGVDEGVDPGYGVEEGGEIDQELPTPPPGIWPPPTPSHPIQPVPDEEGEAGQLPEIPPGSIWPRPPMVPSGKFVVLAGIPGYGWRYVVIDPSTWPEMPEHPSTGGPRPPRPQPK